MKTQNIVCNMLEWVFDGSLLGGLLYLVAKTRYFVTYSSLRYVCLQKCEEIHYTHYET